MPTDVIPLHQWVPYTSEWGRGVIYLSRRGVGFVWCRRGGVWGARVKIAGHETVREGIADATLAKAWCLERLGEDHGGDKRTAE